MPSPRRRLELGCRVGAFALLGWLIGTSVFPAPHRVVEHASSSDVAAHLSAWTRTPSSVSLHAALDAAPSRLAIAWLTALRHAGHGVSWNGSPTPAVIAAEPMIDPTGGVRVSVSAPANSRVTLADAAGPIDSARVGGLGATFIVPLSIDSLLIGVNQQRLTVARPSDAMPRPVLVVGDAGWEAKFVASALEERGWKVVTRFAVAPGVDVHAAERPQIDTAHLSAIIAIDSSVATLGSAVERFVEEGGGLVLAGAAASARSASPLAAGTVGLRTHPNVAANDTIGLGTTGYFPVASLKDDAVAIDRRASGGGVAVAARRVGAGRVLQIGYDDSWRWRMAGAPGAEAAHREWWSRVVSSVAYAPPSVSDARAFDAPVATLFSKLGPPRPAPAASRGNIDPRLLLAIIVVLLLVEWTSRRLRGLR
jgi:hypothetical protein